jgi:hypothetical protein
MASRPFKGNIVKTTRTFASIVLAGLVLAACGGGSGASSSTCSLSNAAGCGGTLQPPSTDPSTPSTPGKPDPAASAAAINIVFSSNELASAGLAGGEVTVTALVKTADNTAVAEAPISFRADSGFLAVASATTDKSGKAVATLGTGGSPLNRTIKVTATVGKASGEASVNVTGTRLAVSGPSFLTLGGSTELVATLVDSAGRPISGEALTVSARNGNTVSTAASSDSRGQVTVHLAGAKRGDEQVVVTALGATATKAVTVGGADVQLTPSITVDAGGAETLKEVPVLACSPVDGKFTPNGVAGTGSVMLSASRGRLYRDAACSTALTGSVPILGGVFQRVWIRSENAGVSTIDATVAGGASASTRVEFVARLGPTAMLNLQANQAVLASGQSSELIAVVRDGTAANNLVKGALVQFSIVSDPSGGKLQSPFNVVTGSDGVARAVFVAGPADGGKEATRIEARLAAVPGALGQAVLTVNKKALSIQFGTGNTLVEHSSSVLQLDYAVFVSDGAGNPVRDVSISAAAWPTHYMKGIYAWNPQTVTAKMPGLWVPDVLALCGNEDAARKGLYESAFDINGNGLLEPGIPLSLVTSGKTDALGITTVSLRYPRDRANWVRVELTVTGMVSGTESVARASFVLPALSKDLTEVTVSPPGMISPYGGSGSCYDPN